MKTIPFKSTTGNQYLIGFTEFENISLSLSVPIVNITIERITDYRVSIGLTDLIKISRIIKDYLESNNVVLYYYCDNKEIERSKKNLSRSPQEYRNILFDKLFEIGSKNGEFIKDDIVINDQTNNIIHFISLISRSSNNASMTQISNEIALLNDK